MILKRNYKRSIQLSERCFEINPSRADHSNLCTAYFFLGKKDKAKKFGKEALVIMDEVENQNFSKIKVPLLKHLKNKTFNLLQVKEIIKPREAKNIIAYSLWGDDPTYLQGAVENAKLALQLYPDWACRFYCDQDIPQETIEKSLEQKAQVFIMPEPSSPFERYAWRFFVTDDPTVKRFICRDVDSRINNKECAAVEAWCHSKKSFHVMRDAIVHCTLILAGLWGGLNEKIPNLYTLYHDMYEHNPAKGGDQEFLATFIWPLIKSDVLVHDTYYQFGGTTFPAGDYSSSEGHVGQCFKLSVVKNGARQ